MTGAAARQPGGRIFGAVFLAAFTAVHTEIALMKLASVMYYSIFVYAMIGVALLGFGAAGSFLAASSVDVRRQGASRIARWLVAFAVLIVPAVLAVDAVRVPAGRIFGSLGGLPLLLLIYLILTVPFVLLGLAIASAFAAWAGDANRLYFADLLGAGAGSAVAIASVPYLGGLPLLGVSGAAAAAGAWLAHRTAGTSPRAAVAVGAANLAVAIAFAAWRPIDVHVAPDKHGPIVSRLAKPGGLATTFSGWSLYGRVDVTEPFATLPPLFGGAVSPRYADLRIEQRMLTLDGAAPAYLYRVDGSPTDLEFLAGTSQSPAYRLRSNPSVLVIGVGGATDVLIALSQGARAVRGVELNPVSAHAVRDVYGSYVGNVLRDPRVDLVVAEGRNFIARDHDTYDIIQLSGVDTGATLGAYGLGTTPESYLYTVEAMEELLAHLAPGGVLSITRDAKFGWAARLAAIARAALLRAGLDPVPRIAAVESWGWTTLLVKREPFTPDEVAALEDFSSTYQFPIVYHPFTPRVGAFDRAIRGGATTDGDTDLRPATDDWPFFFMSFRWSRLPALLRRGESQLIDPIAFLLASLGGLTVLAVALVLLPLWRRRTGLWSTRGSAALIGYFAALGIGFMLVEVALMQRFTIFLGNPVLSVATVLAALLVASGCGSLAARGWRQRGRDPMPFAVAWIALMLLFFASPLVRQLLAHLLWTPLPVRLAVVIALVALTGPPMGVPFPAGLARIADRAGPFVPWAWGINGVTSVVASLGSYLLGMVTGYTTMFFAGIALYVTALALYRRL